MKNKKASLELDRDQLVRAIASITGVLMRFEISEERKNLLEEDLLLFESALNELTKREA
jgi:hypothetical protein